MEFVLLLEGVDAKNTPLDFLGPICIFSLCSFFSEHHQSEESFKLFLDSYPWIDTKGN
jgi:hypothetical protein